MKEFSQTEPHYKEDLQVKENNRLKKKKKRSPQRKKRAENGHHINIFKISLIFLKIDMWCGSHKIHKAKCMTVLSLPEGREIEIYCCRILTLSGI